jgi:hypothetical protein
VSSRSAPPVAVDLGPEPAWRSCGALLWALSAAVAAVWQGQLWGLAQAPAAWAACLGVAFVAGGVGWHLAGAPMARLEWTGREWRLGRRVQAPDQGGRHEAASAPRDLADTGSGAGQACAVEVTIDLGTWMLLRLRVAGQSRRSLLSPDWVAVSQRRVGLAWHGLRVALYATPASAA